MINLATLKEVLFHSFLNKEFFCFFLPSSVLSISLFSENELFRYLFFFHLLYRGGKILLQR